MFPPSTPIVVQTKAGDDVWKYENVWTQSLYNCSGDTDACCIVYWCCPWAMYDIFKRADENCLACCWPMTLWSFRTKIRTLFRIRGSVCGDCLATCCCPCCAIFQMDHEMIQQGL